MYKNEYPFLKEVDSLALANVQLHLEKAYKNFFSDPKTGFPRFKSKHHSKNSYTTNVVNGNILLEGMCRRVPCIGGKDSGAVPQVLGDGKYGVLCDVTDPRSIYEAMKKIEDPILYQSIVKESTEYLLREFPDIVVAQKHIELFIRTMNK